MIINFFLFEGAYGPKRVAVSGATKQKVLHCAYAEFILSFEGFRTTWHSPNTPSVILSFCEGS